MAKWFLQLPPAEAFATRNGLAWLEVFDHAFGAGVLPRKTGGGQSPRLSQVFAVQQVNLPPPLDELRMKKTSPTVLEGESEQGGGGGTLPEGSAAIFPPKGYPSEKNSPIVYRNGRELDGEHRPISNETESQQAIETESQQAIETESQQPIDPPIKSAVPPTISDEFIEPPFGGNLPDPLP